MARYAAAACRNRVRNHWDQRIAAQPAVQEFWDLSDLRQGRAELEWRRIFRKNMDNLERIWRVPDWCSRYLLLHYYPMGAARQLSQQLGLSPAGVRTALHRARCKANERVAWEEGQGWNFPEKQPPWPLARG